MLKLIDFVDLDEKETVLVLKWRNHPDIRKWMLNNKTISLKEHLNFIKDLKIEKNKKYFLVELDDTYIGVVSLVDDFLGVYSNPQKKGVGDTLLQSIIDYAFNIKGLPVLKAKVLKSNTKAIKLYKRFGFEPISTKGDCMIMKKIKFNKGKI